MGRALVMAAALLATATAGANAPRIEPQFEPAPANRFATRILALHNRERQSIGQPPLAWSDALAADAREWAQALAQAQRFEHSPASLRRGQGENLFRGTAGAYSVDEMIGDFLEERADFHPGRFPDVANSGAWQNVGHYTQMIWPGTREVGCAMARGGEWDVLACRYAPEGNIIGVRIP